jgi:hypothetical protein
MSLPANDTRPDSRGSTGAIVTLMLGRPTDSESWESDDPTRVGEAQPRSFNSSVILKMAAAGGRGGDANPGEVANVYPGHATERGHGP